VLVAFLLPSVAVELLVEVPLGVQQTDADQRDTEVCRALRWSPASTPRPPEYWAIVSVIPNSGEK
jgi:hypothetical protein